MPYEGYYRLKIVCDVCKKSKIVKESTFVEALKTARRSGWTVNQKHNPNSFLGGGNKRPSLKGGECRCPQHHPNPDRAKAAKK